MSWLSTIQWRAVLLCGALVFGCAQSSGPARPQAFARSPLFPFEDAPHPNSREQLVKGLQDRGFLDPNAPEGTELNLAIRHFQRSEGLPETGWPSDETLLRIGIDPQTRDMTLWPFQDPPPAATAIGVGH